MGIWGQYVGLITVRADHVDRFAQRYRTLARTGSDAYTSVQLTSYLQSMIDDGWVVRAVPIDGGWLEVDTIDELRMYRERYARGDLATFVDLRRG